MLISFKKSPSGAPYNLAYFPGDLAEIEDAVASDLIYQGIAEKAEAKKPSEKTEKAISHQAANAEKR